jgi:hypothetical protein
MKLGQKTFMDSKDYLDVVIDLAPRFKYRKDLWVYGAHQHRTKEENSLNGLPR